MTSAIGIDLGTTYSCVAVFRNDRVEVIQNDQGNRITPSCVAFTDVQRLIGESAINQIAKNPKNSIYDVKRLIGRKFSDESVQSDMRLWPFDVVAWFNDKPMIKATFKSEPKLFAAEEISSMVLSHMKQIAERYLGAKVTEAVITVPARFNDSQRSATRDAGTIAGLKVMRIINEPTAAAFAYGFDENVGTKNVMIFDAGDTHLGGEDLDNRLVDHFVEEIRRTHKIDIKDNKRALWRLKSCCEKAKRQLSSTTYANIDIECLDKDFDFSDIIARAKFETLTIDLLERFVEPLERCLKDAGMKKSEIDDVVLVGGCSRIPKLRKLLEEFMGGKEFVSDERVHPDEAVAYGAAVQAAILSGGRNAKLKDIMLRDVTPLSLGFEVDYDLMSLVIPRNTPIPVVRKSSIHTALDNQSSIPIDVYEGERSKASDNNLLGGFRFYGIPPAPRGVGKLAVCFDVDADGILNVSATEVKTGSKKSMRITNDGGRLSKKEIETMISDSERYKVEDEIYKKAMEAKNSLDWCVYYVKKSMQSGNLQGIKLQLIEVAISQADQYLKDNNLSEEKYREMEQILKRLSY